MLTSDIKSKCTTFKWQTLVFLFLCSVALPSSAIPIFNYNGTVDLCTGTCDGFASLDIGSELSGSIAIQAGPNGSFADIDIGDFLFSIFNPSAPVSGPIGDPITDNPLFLSSVLGVLASNGSSGNTGNNGELISGQILLEFLVPPLGSNGAFIIFDLASGRGQVCLFFATAGCIPGATEAIGFSGTFTLDQSSVNVSETLGASLLSIGLFALFLRQRRKTQLA